MPRFAVSLFICALFGSPCFGQEFVSIFDGKTLKGWVGDPQLWSVEDGAITGVTSDKKPLPYNKFLIYRGGKVGNFMLRAKVRLIGNNNSGIQYRSQHLKDAGEFVVGGYQADIHPSPLYNGMLYDERGRGILAQHGQRVIIEPSGIRWVVATGEGVQKVKLDEWNELSIMARGNHLVHKLNGKTTVDITDHQKSARELEGILALQVHRGPAMKVQFKDIMLKKLPSGGVSEFDKSEIPPNAKQVGGKKKGGKKKGAKKKTEQVSFLGEEILPHWIWLGKESFPKQTVMFRKIINVQNAFEKAKLYATCDDRMWIYINGKLALESETWQAPSYAEVSKHLKTGKNVIAVRARNQNSNIAGFLMKLVVEYKNDDSEVVVTDNTWRVTEKPKKNAWQSAIDFNDETWTAATSLGKLGTGPWNQVNKTTLAAASKQKKIPDTYFDQLWAKEGFKVERLYSVPENQGSWVSMTTDPKGRLIVSDQYGKLFRVTAPAIGGKKEDIVIEPIPANIGAAQGLLWAFDSLYVSVNGAAGFKSGLYRVRDTDGDDQLDKVELLRPLQGGGEHGPHAVLLSPDGKSLYVECGNHTNLTPLHNSLVPKIWGEDSLLPRMWDASGHARGRMAPGGWIARTDPDGKEWTLFCSGFRNAYDAAFNRDGELFTYDSDMEWDMNTPWYRPTRVCHCVSGAEFGWRGGTAKFPVYYPDNLPPVVDIGPGSPTGIVFGYGAKFPAKYQNALFICDWSYGKLYAVHLTPHGSTYKGEAEEFIRGTPLPLTDIVVNPKDGAMYFAVGGRKTKSALYRVTYEGKEPTTPSKGSDKGAEARSLRRKLEAYHGKHDPKAIDAAWPYLGNKDRFIRFAARTAIEHQEPKLWQQKALTVKEPQASLTALLAVTRAGEKSMQNGVLNALDRLQWKELTRDQKLELLRVYSLCFIRMGEPSDEVAGRLIQKFDPYFPAKSMELNFELCNLLVYLQSPSVATKGMKLLKKALTQEEQMEYALLLRNLKKGWTLDQRKDYFRWFLKAASYKGGNSFGGFVRNIKNEAIAHLSPQEKATLKPILEASPKVEPVKVEPRPFVKKWSMDDLTEVIKTGLKNRDFDNGRKMFAAANCFACHRFANEGGATGPDLTGVGGRFSPTDLLQSMIEPSKVISDQYQAVVVELTNGQVVQGRIVNLAGDSLRINTDMLNPNQLANVNRKQVVSVTPSPVSMMPTGLLDTLNEEEILDLMAYLLSGGNREHPVFAKDK